MIVTVYNLLKPLDIPIKFLQRPSFGKDGLAISYHFFNEGNLVYGDGKPIKSGGALQIDIFSKLTDYTSTVKVVKEALSSANFKYANGSDDIENLSNSEQIYHKVLIFNYVENGV